MVCFSTGSMHSTGSLLKPSMHPLAGTAGNGFASRTKKASPHSPSHTKITARLWDCISSKYDGLITKTEVEMDCSITIK